LIGLEGLSIKRLKKLLLVSLPSLLATLLILELGFRFAIPASNPPHAYYDADEQIFQYDVNGPRSGTYTAGKSAALRGRWRINNMGWNSEIDYTGDRGGKPLMAIIGDSFIAALQVNVEDSMPALLRKELGDKMDVYSFGTPGAPLSQYVQIARYVNRNFDPDILVFNVVENDFTESLCRVRRNLGMMCLAEKDGQIMESPIVPYTPSKLRRSARNSSLVRYMFLNLHVSTGFIRSVDPSQTELSPLGGGPTELSLRDSVENATDYVLRTIAEENPDKTVIFIMDGPRRTLYDEDFEGPDVSLWQHSLMRDITSSYGFHFIDLTDDFKLNYERYGQRFDSKIDYHWNENGHSVAAESLIVQLQTIGATSSR